MSEQKMIGPADLAPASWLLIIIVTVAAAVMGVILADRWTESEQSQASGTQVWILDADAWIGEEGMEPEEIAERQQAMARLAEQLSERGDIVIPSTQIMGKPNAQWIHPDDVNVQQLADESDHDPFEGID